MKQKNKHLKNRICKNCKKHIEFSRGLQAKYCKVCGVIASAGSTNTPERMLELKLQSQEYILYIERVEVTVIEEPERTLISVPGAKL